MSWARNGQWPWPSAASTVPALATCNSQFTPQLEFCLQRNHPAVFCEAKCVSIPRFLLHLRYLSPATLFSSLFFLLHQYCRLSTKQNHTLAASSLLFTMRGSSHKPPKPVSRIPTSPSPVLNDTERKVQIGFRPIGGRAAAWTFGIVHKLFKGFDKKDDGADGTRQRAPDPHYHWCVLVGDYYHQIQITDGMIWYDNNKTSWSK